MKVDIKKKDHDALMLRIQKLDALESAGVHEWAGVHERAGMNGRDMKMHSARLTMRMNTGNWWRNWWRNSRMA